jgi:MSHA biogenesis protein MshJ
VKRWLARAAERIDAYSLRERVLMFLAVSVVMVAMLDVALLQPRLNDEKHLSAELAKRQNEMRELNVQVQKLALSRQADPDREVRRRLSDTQGALSKLDQRIADEQRKFTTPEQMRGMLEEMLARGGRLRLIDLRTLPPVAISAAKAQDGSAAKPAAAAEQFIFRHGVEVTVSGSYLDLLGYLGDLERLPTQMHWGALDLKVEEHPAVRMKLKVYTLSVDKAWMRV